MQTQDAKMMSKNEDGKKDYAHIKCFKCGSMEHFASKCPTKLEKKAQAKRKCYSCREREHMAHSCPLGDISKPISIIDNNVLRKDGNGTSMVAIAKTSRYSY